MCKWSATRPWMQQCSARPMQKTFDGSKGRRLVTHMLDSLAVVGLNEEGYRAGGKTTG